MFIQLIAHFSYAKDVIPKVNAWRTLVILQNLRNSYSVIDWNRKVSSNKENNKNMGSKIIFWKKRQTRV